MSTQWTLILTPLRRQRRALLLLAACTAAQAVPAFCTGRVLALAVDRGFLAGHPGTGLAWLAALAGLAGVGAVGTVTAFRHLGAAVEPTRDHVLRAVVTGTLRRATAGRGAPDTAAVARLTTQVSAVRDVSAGLLMIVGQFACVSAAALLGLLSLSPALALLATVPVAASVAAFLALLPALNRRQHALLLADERFAALAGTVATGTRDIAACGVEARYAAAVGEGTRAQVAAARAVARGTLARTGILALGGELPVVLILLAAPALLRRGTTIGELVGALAYVTGALHPALRTFVHGIGAAGLRLAVILRRLAAAGATDPAPPPPAGQPASGQPASGPLRASGIHFRYGPGAEPILTDFYLHLDPGEHLAVIGPSGAGKSTLANLLAGLTEPQRGTVHIGQTPLRAADRVLVPQEAYVFAGTLAENLTYPDIPPHRLPEAAALPLAGLVRKLGGYGAQLIPATLSAGERQLIAVTRAYLSPAPIVLLDEATCHLDPATEEAVERAFAARPGTLVVIAHRLASAARADRILLLDGGTAHLGTHRDLLGVPAYRHLHEAACT